jgi:hypothetical protein
MQPIILSLLIGSISAIVFDWIENQTLKNRISTSKASSLSEFSII